MIIVCLNVLKQVSISHTYEFWMVDPHFFKYSSIRLNDLVFQSSYFYLIFQELLLETNR